MTSVEKSPNMMSTTGLIPVIAAPTAIPVNPGSEIGVSRTRSGPNSSTSPVSTLKTVPASAMSSPQMNTVESRRISSESASRTASPKVNSRVSGINILIHLVDRRIWRVDRKLDRPLHFLFGFFLDTIQRRAIREFFGDQPVGKNLDRVALGLPQLFFFLRAVVIALDVADMVTMEAIRVEHQ